MATPVPITTDILAMFLRLTYCAYLSRYCVLYNTTSRQARRQYGSMPAAIPSGEGRGGEGLAGSKVTPVRAHGGSLFDEAFERLCTPHGLNMRLRRCLECSPGRSLEGEICKTGCCARGDLPCSFEQRAQTEDTTSYRYSFGTFFYLVEGHSTLGWGSISSSIH